MKSRSIRRYAGALLCSAPAIAAAQQAASSTPQLDAITVTAQRVPTDGRTLPVSISVITAEDIAAASARTMQDLLSTQAGIHLINNSSSSDNSIVDLRGFGITGASNTLILIDGVKQNTNDLSAPSLGVVPLDQVERIEIVRGSGSVQYGGGTTGGVINIITRSDFSKEPVSARATATFGSYGLRQYDAAVAMNNEKVGIDLEHMSTNIGRIAFKFINRKEKITKVQADRRYHLYLHWCAKEALYKICDKEGISIRKNITIEPFEVKESGVMKGRVITDKINDSFDLFYTRYDNYAIVWTKKNYEKV